MKKGKRNSNKDNDASIDFVKWNLLRTTYNVSDINNYEKII